MDQIKNYLSRSIQSIKPEAIVTMAAIQMKDKNIGSLLVKENGNYIGIITEGDLSRRVIARERDPLELTVRDIMTQPLITIKSDALMPTAFLVMSQKNIRHIAVVEDKIVIGMLSIRDFVHYFKRKYSHCRKSKATPSPSV